MAKKPAAAAFGGVASYHTDTQATAIVPNVDHEFPLLVNFLEPICRSGIMQNNFKLS